MSYLTRPRAYFSGKFNVNTATGNNSTADWTNEWVYYDVDNVKVNLKPGMTPQDFRQWMYLLNQNQPDPYVNGIWNYYGDNSVTFQDMTITGVHLQQGNLISNPASDSIIGANVSLLGNKFGDNRTGAVLVDVDPVDAFTSQIFSDFLGITGADGSSLVQGTGNHTAFSYWLNFWRNLMVTGDGGCSAVWQFAIPNETLSFVDTSNSPFLQELSTAAQQGQGILMRITTYLFLHLSYDEIADRFKAGNYAPTSGEMVISGVIGAWGAGELQSVPACRMLYPNTTKPLINPYPTAPASKKAYFLGPVLANVDSSQFRITLDMTSTIPETNSFDTYNQPLSQLPEKQNYGPLNLWALMEGKPPVYLGNVVFSSDNPDLQPAYNQMAYMATSGIVEINYNASISSYVDVTDLMLTFGDDMTPILQENPINIITDQRGVYLELEDKDWVNIPVQVLYRGKPAQAGLTFNVSQIFNADYPTPSSSQQVKAQPPRSEHTTLRNTALATAADPVIVNFSGSITTGNNGMAQLSVQPLTAGISKLWIQTPDDPKGNPGQFGFIDGMTHYFINVRVLPDDSGFDNVSNEQLTWDFMYENFFMYYSLIYPTMNNHIDFDDESSVRAQASLIKNFVVKRQLGSTLYMPITRELSAGKRRLVQRWCSMIE